MINEKRITLNNDEFSSKRSDRTILNIDSNALNSKRKRTATNSESTSLGEEHGVNHDRAKINMEIDDSRKEEHDSDFDESEEDSGEDENGYQEDGPVFHSPPKLRRGRQERRRMLSNSKGMSDNSSCDDEDGPLFNGTPRSRKSSQVEGRGRLPGGQRYSRSSKCSGTSSVTDSLVSHRMTSQMGTYEDLSYWKERCMEAEQKVKLTTMRDRGSELYTDRLNVNASTKMSLILVVKSFVFPVQKFIDINELRDVSNKNSLPNKIMDMMNIPKKDRYDMWNEYGFLAKKHLDKVRCSRTTTMKDDFLRNGK